MNRKTKEEDGIAELKKFMTKNNSPEDLTLLFHSLFDKTNEIWKNRIKKLKNFGKKQRLTSEKIAKKLENILPDYNLIAEHSPSHVALLVKKSALTYRFIDFQKYFSYFTTYYLVIFVFWYFIFNLWIITLGKVGM